MSLYNHVANKDDLLDGMVDIVFSEIELPAGEADWRTAMRQRAIAARAVLSRHPWAIGLMESRTKPGPATLRHHDAVIGCLREAGFSLALAAHAYSAPGQLHLRFRPAGGDLPFKTPEEAAAVAEASRAVPRRHVPPPRRVHIQHVLQPGYDYADEFAFGLDLILEGLEKAAAAAA